MCREFMYKMGLWSIIIPLDVKQAVQNFVSVNQTYWMKVNCSESRILVEGHLSQYGPNYAFRSALAAKAIQEKYNLEISVVFDGFSYQWEIARMIYSSFRIDDFIYLGSKFIFRNIYYSISAIAKSSVLFFQLIKPNDILNISIDNIMVGDLIYDDLIKHGNRKTINRLDFDVFKTIVYSYYYFMLYKHLFQIGRYTYYIATHTQFIQYGLLCRVALLKGVKVIETTDIQMSYYNEISPTKLPTYHQGLSNVINGILEKQDYDSSKLCEYAMNSINNRMDSNIDQIDVEKAYKGEIIRRKDLQKIFNINPNNTIIFIMAHVFKDSPHSSSMMLHLDYYSWLFDTIKVASQSKNIDWIVKPHPASSLYNETGDVEDMINIINSSNIHLCYEDFNTKSIKYCADAIVTVYGTAGLEFACLGIPVLLAGRSFYAGHGFTIEPQTLSDYHKILLSMNKIKRLTENKINSALEVYAIW